MKNIYSIIILLLLSSMSYCQCNTSMAGTWTQSDSCTYYSNFQSSTVSITAGSGTDINIHDFGDIVPAITVHVTLDCVNLTATIPYQTDVNLNGSGTFTADFNYMNLTYSKDMGSYTSYCVMRYSRVGVGIADNINKKTHFSVYPNPFTTHATLLTEIPLHNATLIIYNALGQQVRVLNNLKGQSVQIQRDNLPKGLYFVSLLQDGIGVSMGKLVVEEA